MRDRKNDERWLNSIEHKIKKEIAMQFYIAHKRRPTKPEYESTFKDWVSKLKCEVSEYDLGMYKD